MLKCQEALRIRKNNQLKYRRVILTDYLPSTSGYHLDCCKTFTALGKTHRNNLQEMTEPLRPQPESKITRSFSKLDKTNRIGIFPKTCIFCGKIRKTVKKNEQKLVQAETKNFEVNIKKYANWLDDEEMLRKISNIVFIAKKIRYHGFCRT